MNQLADRPTDQLADDSDTSPTTDGPPTTTDFYLDLRGESCPYPVIHSLEALAELERGERIEIVSDCPQAYRNIPDEATNVGSRMLSEPVRDGAQMSFFIEKGAPFDTRRAVKAAKAANRARNAR